MTLMVQWGVPTSNGKISMEGYYPTKLYRELVDKFRSVVTRFSLEGHLTKSCNRTNEDTGIFLVDTTNWITAVSHLIPFDEHLNVSGNEHVVEKFAMWLEKWGV